MSHGLVAERRAPDEARAASARVARRTAAGIGSLMTRLALLFTTGLLLSVAPALAQQRVIGLDALRSGLSFQAPAIKAMQADDFANPAQLWLDRGAQLWSSPAGSANIACAQCHGEATRSMAGVAAHYPQFDTVLARLLNLSGRIDACRVTHQRAPAFTAESDDAIAIAAYVGSVSRGMPIGVSIEGPARAHFEAGQALYYLRMGQMNLACNNCHEQNWGRRLLAETISQGQPNAYPIYRIEWQKAGSLHRRFRSCLSGVRAEMWPYGAAEYLDLELFLAWRAEGLAIETPGVRK